MSKWIHRLTEVDREAWTAVCANCGPVAIKRVGKGVRCKTALREYRREHPHWKRRRGTHGLTREEAHALKEGKACAICGAAEDLRVDHDHATGGVRGVLCQGCNVGLGFFRDSAQHLRAAIAYLEKEKGAS
jgi:hypothetical protein